MLVDPSPHTTRCTEQGRKRSHSPTVPGHQVRRPRPLGACNQKITSQSKPKGHFLNMSSFDGGRQASSPLFSGKTVPVPSPFTMRIHAYSVVVAAGAAYEVAPYDAPYDAP